MDHLQTLYDFGLVHKLIAPAEAGLAPADVEAGQ
jgi:hypothetical protein